MNIDRKSKIKRSKNLCLICSNSKITHPQKFKQGNKSCNDCLLKHKEKRRQKALLGKCINCRNDKRFVPEKFRGLNKTCDDCLLKNQIRVINKSKKRTKTDSERMIILKKEKEKVIHRVIGYESPKNKKEEGEKEKKRQKKKEEEIKEELEEKEEGIEREIKQYKWEEENTRFGKSAPFVFTFVSNSPDFKSLHVLSELCYNIAKKNKNDNYCSNQKTDSNFKESFTVDGEKGLLHNTIQQHI
eukprot:TRINITY_DN2043_c0_g1_i1.p1 TRINITY_DN2043_c0_g1~~TRINITY_DN2043_c0_g1_i1.p1  ORF type:complete len:243 (+),score=58.61 TRINITY_DN2043_c0_g1_i1:298-1026(+)